MGNIKLLDCTLRDGGYINDWRFGEQAVNDITNKLTDAGMDYVEIGFLKDEGNVAGRTMFPSVNEISRYTHGSQKNGVTYCAMCEALNPLPVDRIDENNHENIDVIRVIVWTLKVACPFVLSKNITSTPAFASISACLRSTHLSLVL